MKLTLKSYLPIFRILFCRVPTEEVWDQCVSPFQPLTRDLGTDYNSMDML